MIKRYPWGNLPLALLGVAIIIGGGYDLIKSLAEGSPILWVSDDAPTVADEAWKYTPHTYASDADRIRQQSQQIRVINRAIEQRLGVAPGGDVRADPVFQKYCGRLPVHNRGIGEPFGPYTRTALVYVTLEPSASWGSDSHDDPDWSRTYCAIHALLLMDKESFDLIDGTCQVGHTKDGRIFPYISEDWRHCPRLESAMLVDRAKSKLGGWFTSYRFRTWIVPQP